MKDLETSFTYIVPDLPNNPLENTHSWGRITVQLVSSLTRLDLTKEENMLFLFVAKQLNQNFSNSEGSPNPL